MNGELFNGVPMYDVIQDVKDWKALDTEILVPGDARHKDLDDGSKGMIIVPVGQSEGILRKSLRGGLAQLTGVFLNKLYNVLEAL